MHILNLGVCLWSVASCLRVLLDHYDVWTGPAGDAMDEKTNNDRLAIAYEQFRKWTRERKIPNPNLNWQMLWCDVVVWTCFGHGAPYKIPCGQLIHEFLEWSGTANLASQPSVWPAGSTPILSWQQRRTTYFGAKRNFGTFPRMWLAIWFLLFCFHPAVLNLCQWDWWQARVVTSWLSDYLVSLVTNNSTDERLCLMTKHVPFCCSSFNAKFFLFSRAACQQETTYYFFCGI